MKLNGVAVKAFQVWSNVLGSSLTKVQPNGDKWETKVFAGGAVIAKQGLNGIDWMTSDPVTGTEAKFINTSNGTATDTTEHEPLGQTVLEMDPAELPDPPANESVSHWEGMQWQCTNGENFNGGFDNLPWHCQWATRNQQSYEKKENPQHIEETPPPGQEPVPEENTPTEKPQAEAGGRDANAGGSAGDGGVPASSRPTLKPQKTKSKPTIRPRRTKAERDAAREAAAANPVGVDEGDPHYSSRSRGSLDMSHIPGFEAAENRRDKITQEEANKTRDRIVDKAILLLSNDKCNKALTGQSSVYGYDALEKLKDLKKKGLIEANFREKNSYKPAKGNPAGYGSSGSIILYQSFFTGFFLIPITRDGKKEALWAEPNTGKQADERKVFVLLHELAHVTNRAYHLKAAYGADKLSQRELNTLVFENCIPEGM